VLDGETVKDTDVDETDAVIQQVESKVERSS